MSITISEIHRKLLEQISEQNGFKNGTIEQYATSAKGDNYVGQIISVRIKEGEEKLLEVILKRAPTSEKVRYFFPLRDIFLNEIYLYDTVLPTFLKFQTENSLENIFESYPRLYGKCEEDIEECLVLENLIKNGYKHWNRKVPMNSDHISLVMKEYGKFHAISFAMKKKNPELFRKLCEGLKKEDIEKEKEEIEGFLKSSSMNLRKAVRDKQELKSVLDRVTENAVEYFFEEISGPEEFKVITHGDCWCNNMVFKYENPDDVENPTKVSLIDWQISKYGLPLQDIVYFFYASSPKEILYDYKKYLKIYHDSLSERLRQMNCDSDELFPFADLETWWKKFGKYGLFLGGVIFNILYVDSKNAPQVDEKISSAVEFFNQFGGVEHEQKVNERITDLFTFMIDNDFL